MRPKPADHANDDATTASNKERPPTNRPTNNETDKPPFVQQSELVFEGGPSPKWLFNQCPKHHGHQNYIPVKDMTKEHLPPEYRTDEFMTDIEHYSDRIVKVTTFYTSQNRPDFYPNTRAPYFCSEYKGCNYPARVGTGYIRYTLPSGIVRGKPCPCRLCKESGIPEETFLFATVTTAAHVVFDEEEAEHTVFEMFYDTEDKKDVKILYGVKKALVYDDGSGEVRRRGSLEYGEIDETSWIDNKCDEDRTLVTCVTHDPDLIALLPTIRSKFDFERPPIPFMVFHPHGFCKHICFTGSFLSCVVPVPFGRQNYDEIHTLGPGSKCRMRPTNTKSTKSSIEEFFRIVDIAQSSEGDGIEYTLREGIILSLSPEAGRLCEYIPMGKYGDDPYEKTYVKRFPIGTRFTTYKNIQEDSFLLPDVEFLEENGTKIGFPKRTRYFWTYSIDTCPGCSGAPVLAHFDLFPLYWDSHSGALPDGTNRSGIHTPKHVNY